MNTEIPSPGKVVLLQVPKPDVRAVLRRILSEWSQLSENALPLRETSSGPVWVGLLHGHSLDISLSYAGEEGWIALRRGGFVGVDVMEIQSIPEAEEMARHYLGSQALSAMRQAADPARVFAVAWTELEARLKCMKRTLTEWSRGQAQAVASCVLQTTILPGERVISVATFTEPATEKVLTELWEWTRV